MRLPPLDITCAPRRYAEIPDYEERPAWGSGNRFAGAKTRQTPSIRNPN